MSIFPPVPYIGVTGIVTPDDLDTVRECVRTLRDNCPTVLGGDPTHRFMAGVLVSHKTLNGLPTTNRRYPARTMVETLLKGCMEAGAWPVIHYNTHAKGDALALELEQLCKDFPSMRGLQLNLVCPNPEVVKSFASDPTRRVEVILQINHTSLVKSAVPPAKIGHPCDYAMGYSGISHALMDASGGRGKAFDPVETADTICGTIDTLSKSGVRLGLAGGLGPECSSLLEDLKAGLWGYEGDPDIELRELSFDAESRVRVLVPDPIEGEKYQDMLDRTKCIAYVAAVCAALKD
jgi:hypothetical protein